MTNPVIDLLHNRCSVKKLVAPYPQGAELDMILRAGMRVPDHGNLKPYRFVVIAGAPAKAKFARLLQQTCDELDLNDKMREKAAKIPNLAPQIIAVVSQVDSNHPKVPVWEQIVTAGCAVYAMQLAANSLGYHNFWLTNKWITSQITRQAFGISNPDDIIVGLLLCGTALEVKDLSDKLATEARKLPDFVTYW